MSAPLVRKPAWPVRPSGCAITLGMPSYRSSPRYWDSLSHGLTRGCVTTIAHVVVASDRVLTAVADVMKILYNSDVLSEKTILLWYTKGKNPKVEALRSTLCACRYRRASPERIWTLCMQQGRSIFVADMEPFIKWLEEASEDDGEES